MTTEQIRIRLTDDETELLKALAARCGLQPSSLVAVFVRAALHAVAANRDTIPMPLRFEVTEAPSGYSLHEPPSQKKK